MEAASPALAGWALLALIALPLLLAAVHRPIARLPILERRPWLPAVLCAGSCLVGLSALRAFAGEAALALPWIGAWNIELRLRLDGLAFLFAVLVTGIGLLILAFSAAYMPRELRAHRSAREPETFYGGLIFFMGSMLGLVCADELFTLYAFWEATSVSSFLLIAHHLHERRPRSAAVQAFTITTAAGLLLFLGFLLIRGAADTSALPALARATDLLHADPHAPLIGACLLVGAVAKSAQAPLHIWLPSAMVAPTPVSAYLHSATMVAAGVFLIARLAPILGALSGFGGMLIAIGAVTMLAGGIGATAQNDLKRLLAWSTISQYGSVALLLGLQAWGAATFLLAGHAIIKAGLFLVAGLVTRATGERDLRRLGGLHRHLPATTAVAGVLSLGLAGLPATAGFWMKELLFASALEARLPWLATAVFSASVLTLVYMLRFFWRTFLGRPYRRRVPQERRLRPLLLPPLALAAIAVAVGIAPGLAAALTDPAAESAAGAPVTTPFSIGWPPHPALLLSLLTFAAGAGAFAWLERRERKLALVRAAERPRSAQPALPPALLLAALLPEIGPARAWRWILRSAEAFARLLARAQTGKLVHYLLLLVAVPVVAALGLLPRVDRWPELLPLERMNRATIAMGTLAAAAVGLALAAAIVRSHIASILMVGVVGFVLALIFALLRAPDVALVQVAVETVGALLLLVVLSRIRITLREAAMSPQGRRPRAGRVAAVATAGAAGAVVAATSLAMQANLGDPLLGRIFFERTAALHLEAVVTAILVDFRGLDTFGEITVFAAAALATVLLLDRGTSGVRDPEAKDGR